MGRTRVLRQRPLAVRKETTTQKMYRGMEELRRRKIIRQLVIDSARQHGFEIREISEERGEAN